MKKKNENKPTYAKASAGRQIVIYQAPSGAIELRGDFEKETIWATQAEIASVFGVTPQNITMHLQNIYKQKELKKQATCKESLQVQDEGGRKVERRIDALTAIGTTKKSIILSGKELTEAIVNLRNELTQKGEATEMFAQERAKGSIEGIVGNIMQSFGGKPVYESVEEQAAHLLYFMVKNHPSKEKRANGRTDYAVA